MRRSEPPRTFEVAPHDLVLVKWLDAAGHRNREDADPVPCLSVGWVVEVGEKDGKSYLKLASEVVQDDDGSYDTQEHVSIPLGMVDRIIPIRRRLPAPFSNWRPKDDE